MCSYTRKLITGLNSTMTICRHSSNWLKHTTKMKPWCAIRLYCRESNLGYIYLIAEWSTYLIEAGNEWMILVHVCVSECVRVRVRVRVVAQCYLLHCSCSLIDTSNWFCIVLYFVVLSFAVLCCFVVLCSIFRTSASTTITRTSNGNLFVPPCHCIIGIKRHLIVDSNACVVVDARQDRQRVFSSLLFSSRKSWQSWWS